jgi:cytochrome c-type biogenesis protein CcmH
VKEGLHWRCASFEAPLRSAPQDEGCLALHNIPHPEVRAAGEPRRTHSIRAALFAVLFALSAPAHAVQPDEILKDPVAESRARKLSSELRCLVCQNESIDDSNAPLAKDLRLLVRERITAGDTDDQVKAFLVQRYGEFVLLRPPVSLRTLALYGAPFAALVLGGLLIWRRSREKVGPVAVAGLSDEEKARLDKVLSKR